MLRGAFDAAGEYTPGELHSQYEALLRETIETVGQSAVADESGVDEQRVEAVADGDSPELTLEEAAAILATDPARPDTESIVAEARDILLLGMSTAVLDVEAIAAGIDDEMDPKEIQQKVEGRYPMTLAEYAVLHQYIEREKP